MSKQSKVKRYWVDFQFSIQVTGYVHAKNKAELKEKIECSSVNPSFDDMDEHDQPVLGDFEYETILEIEKDE
jgi:hypothetical protein